MTAKQSIRGAFAEASSFLTQCGVMEPQRNAQLLLEHVLGLSSTAYYMALPELFPEEFITAWEDAVTRKAAGEPAQYIIGEQEFYGLLFTVTPSVLIPRPETELLVEAILQQAERLWPGRTVASANRDVATAAGTNELAPLVASEPLVVADIGTGSGAIAVTLASQASGLRVYASDISPEALRVAERNAARHGAAVAFREGNLLAPFAGMALDILVSNPPYIPADTIAGLQREVRDFEPRLALDGGEDGLWPYRIMIEQIDLLEAPPRIIGFELGMGQAMDVADMLRQAGHWSEIIIVPDLAGIDRHVIGVDSLFEL
ncbi:peptide chain release factor N(5)-glutamine methyltransferase [Paenibacillus antarcticus]|uniref:Release factor glutamine methyltransferase n=1 Tax=Paenibacillus antarcticus TaxID=253703 RepID=A0A168QFP9_9BACL|nr:peptide chain release factor N(5)-glutamine methyltransferase [Paenibacillus antarcticus]OAB47733.1 protein-(glutamine-N5) methyltransferase, release factor-specific [Paenibacillus antarcticus]